MSASDITFDFSGRVAIVTGAGAGLGRAIALELARSGAAVIVGDLKQDVADKGVAEIEAAGGKAVGVAGDVADPANAEALVRAAQDLPGTLSMAVNNAGIGGPHADAGNYLLDGWAKVIDVNLNGVFYGMRAQLAAMAAAGIQGVHRQHGLDPGERGLCGVLRLCRGQAWGVGMTKTAAWDYGARGIRVNAVGPGFILTPLVESAMAEAALQGLAGRHAPGGLGTPEEVAALILFLVSDRASFIAGSYHLIDGGYTAA